MYVRNSLEAIRRIFEEFPSGDFRQEVQIIREKRQSLWEVVRNRRYSGV